MDIGLLETLVDISFEGRERSRACGIDTAGDIDLVVLEEGILVGVGEGSNEGCVVDISSMGGSI